MRAEDLYGEAQIVGRQGTQSIVVRVVGGEDRCRDPGENIDVAPEARQTGEGCPKCPLTQAIAAKWEFFRSA